MPGAPELKRQAALPEPSRALETLSSLSFALILLLVISTPFVEMSGEVSVLESAYRIYAYGFVASLQVALIAVRGWERSLRIYATTLVPFFLWAGLSFLWTQHVDLTGKRLALLLLVYAGIFGGICDLSHQRSLSILRTILAVALMVNFATVFAEPHIGTHHTLNGDLWRGLMAHKNIAGILCAFTVIAFTYDGGTVPLAVRLPVIVGALVFLGHTWSKTALIALPLALAAGGVLALLRDRDTSSTEAVRKIFVSASRVLPIILITGLLVLTFQGDFLLALTEDTSTLTTRGAIWRPMIQFYLDRPALGSGYGAYWDASDRLIDPLASKQLWKNVDQGHNGYLDLLVQVGLPGLAVALYATLAFPLAQLAAMIGRYPQRTALIFAVLIFSWIENISESSLLADDALGNGILLIALAQIHRMRLRSSKTTAALRQRRAKNTVE